MEDTVELSQTSKKPRTRRQRHAYQQLYASQNSDVEQDLFQNSSSTNRTKASPLVVRVTLHKEHPDQPLGIFWMNENQQTSRSGGVMIRDIQVASLAASEPDLRSGMRLITLNNVDFQPGSQKTASDIPQVISSTGGATVTIVAVVPAPSNPVSTRITGPPPPPGVESGGAWGSSTFRGHNTKCAGLFCCLVLPILGLVMCFFPFDKRLVYKVNDRIYDEQGILLGLAENFPFKEVDDIIFITEESIDCRQLQYGLCCVVILLATLAVVIYAVLFVTGVF